MCERICISFVTFEGCRVMKKLLIGSICVFTALQSFAYDERDASKLVKKFSETVACQLEDAGQQKEQYKAVKLASDDKDTGQGAMYVVFWYGDLGCSGGNGTVTPNFTVVEHTGFSSTAPIVMLDYKFPDISLVSLSSFTAQNGVLNIKGVTYGPNDNQHQPKTPVTYRLKFVDGKFVKQ